jgi:hypothetical protein
MNRVSLFAAGALVLLANGFALTHAARNRSGEPEADFVLTGRELPSRNYRKEDSGVELFLNWLSPDTGSGWQRFQSYTWLQRQKLSELGFDCSMEPSLADSEVFYRRQRARRAFAAFEYNGPAWMKLWDQQEEKARNQNRPDRVAEYLNLSHLVVIDAASDPVALRRRHPDRHSVIILPVAVRIRRMNAIPAMGGRPATPAIVVGYVEVSTSVHVPRPFSGLIPPHSNEYRVHLRVGSLYDPWVAGIEPGIK